MIQHHVRSIAKSETSTANSVSGKPSIVHAVQTSDSQGGGVKAAKGQSTDMVAVCAVLESWSTAAVDCIVQDSVKLELLGKFLAEGDNSEGTTAPDGPEYFASNASFAFWPTTVIATAKVSKMMGG